MKSSGKISRNAHQVAAKGRSDYPELLELIRLGRAMVNVHVLRIHQVKAKTGLANSTIWKCAKNGTLPPPLSISTGSVGWLESELDAVIAARLFASRTGNAVDIVAFVKMLTLPNDFNLSACPIMQSGASEGGGE